MENMRTVSVKIITTSQPASRMDWTGLTGLDWTGLE